MGLRVYIYRSDYDSTLNVFHGRSVITLVNADGPFAPDDDAPAARLDRGPLGDPVIVPVDTPSDRPAGPFAGGTYGATSDSRFDDAIRRVSGRSFHGAVPIHDRFDTWDDHYALSR